MNKNKQKSVERELDFGPTPDQKLLFETSRHNFDHKKVKKSFIKIFGTKNIRISGGMSLDEFIEEWCRVNRPEFNLNKERWERYEQLVNMLIDLPDLFTKGQRNVWFTEVDKKD